MTPEQTGLRTLKAEAIHSLDLDGELMGLVVLGPKRGGQLYTAEDLTFLTALGQITAVALRCARIHQDIAQLNEELRRKVDRIAQQDQKIALLQAELNATREVSAPAVLDSLRRESILGSSTSLSAVLDTASKVAASDTSVLIRGESGTGKELMARAIHENSGRRGGPLISVHCAALAEGLLESELFGHVKGAFTGAHSDRRGRFEMAEGGTLFLDEVGDIPLVTQVKLLRVLQERQFEPVGSGQTVSVNVRLIAATHRNLEQLIRDGRFREDLYYRLNVVSLTLPPLRDRQEDILELAMHFLKRAALKNGRPMPQLADDVVYLLRAYRWPGNVRELENAIERAVVVSDGVTIQPHDLPPIVWKEGPDLMDSDRLDGLPKQDSSRDAEAWTFESESAERQRLIDMLRTCRGNKARAARELGLPRSTFFSKLKKYAITDV
ncbi:MAG: sigma-54-dependent Fis family transcriptional regulator [Planctomycetaceae bacterium]|nr:sigma-54-dependent Fis family transcriptional regulator [Planctomycetaceae bacterium]